MSLEVNKVSFSGSLNSVANTNSIKKSQAVNTNLLAQDCKDTVNFKGKELSEDEQKELVLKARTKASGYAFWFGPFSVLYYGLRSNKKVAEKYDLDPVADEKLVKTIKRHQLLWTLPACIPGLGLLPGGIAYLYNKNTDASKIEI